MARIEPVDAVEIFKRPVDTIALYKILSSQKISDEDKCKYIKQHSSEIKSIAKSKLSKEEFEYLMQNRPLIRFKPLKNSFTKKVDDKLFAQAVGIDNSEIKGYIESIIGSNFAIHDRQERDNIEMAKSYVYRHGSKDQVVKFLEYELSDVKNTLDILYKTLDENSGGVAGYFSRPVHHMDNKTLRNIYRVIDKSLKNSMNAGYIDNEEYIRNSEKALIQIYQIQNNSRIIKAYRLYQDLK